MLWFSHRLTDKTCVHGVFNICDLSCVCISINARSTNNGLAHCLWLSFLELTLSPRHMNSGTFTSRQWGGSQSTLYLSRPTTRTAFLPGSGLWAVTRLMACKLVIESKHQLRPGRSSFISGELKAGGIAYINVCLERSYDPLECHPVSDVLNKFGR